MKWCVIYRQWVVACNHPECGPADAADSSMLYCYVEKKRVYSCTHFECIQQRDRDDLQHA
jgi:hypothetical protein